MKYKNKSVVSVYMENELKRELKTGAKFNRRSLSEWIVKLLTAGK